MSQIKTTKLIITFTTTTAAMAMDSVCTPDLGQLITIPTEMTAGCGFAWCAEPQNQTILVELMQKHNIAYQEQRLLELY